MSKNWLFSFAFLLLAFSSSFVNATNSTCPCEGSNGLAITRDSYGMPMITGGELPDIARAIGFVQAQDRLWQIFYITQVANGRAAQYLGSDYLPSDISQHQINYTDAQVQNQIDAFFTNKTKTFYQSYVQGLNDYVAQVNADNSILPYELKGLGFKSSNPVPNFTIYDIIRANQFVLTQFSTSSNPSYQLSNLSDLQLLATNFGLTKAQKIFNDIDPTTAQVNSEFTIVPNTNCSSSSKNPNEPQDQTDQNTIGWSESFHPVAQEAKALAKKLKAMRDLYKKTGISTIGSNGQVINATKSASGNPMLRIAPQPNFNMPSDFYQIRVDENTIGFRGNYFTIPSIPIVTLGIINNYGVALEVGHLPSNDYLCESSQNAYKVRTDTIYVLNHPHPIHLDIYRSTSNGWVTTNPVVQGQPILNLTISIY